MATELNYWDGSKWVPITSSAGTGPATAIVAASPPPGGPVGLLWVDTSVVTDPGTGVTVDLSDYYTKAEVDQLLVDAATGGTIDLGGYYTSDEVDAAFAKKTELAALYTKGEADGIFATQVELQTVANDLGAELGNRVTTGDFEVFVNGIVDGYYSKADADKAFATKAEFTTLSNDIGTELAERITRGEFENFTDQLIDGFYTKVDADVRFALKGETGITEHAEALPTFAPGMTPRQVIAAWSAYDSGLHLFTGGSGGQRVLALVSKSSMTGTVNTPNGIKPTATDEIRITVWIGGAGSTSIVANDSTVDGASVATPSTAIAQQSGQWMRMASTQGDQAFAPTGQVDLFNPATVDVVSAISGKDITPHSVSIDADGGYVFDNRYALTMKNDPDYGTRLAFIGESTTDFVVLKNDLAEVQTALDAKADKAEYEAFAAGIGNELATRYTKAEADAKFATSPIDPAVIRAAVDGQALSLKAVTVPTAGDGAYAFGSDSGFVCKVIDPDYGFRPIWVQANNNLLPNEDYLILKSDLDAFFPAGAVRQAEFEAEKVAEAQRILEVTDKLRTTLEQMRDLVAGIQGLTPEAAEDIARKVFAGGREVPKDIDWTECPKVAGSGLIEARLVAGTIQLRGTVTITTSSWVKVRTLPPNFPMPTISAPSIVHAFEAGIAERVGLVSIGTDGSISINSFAQKITGMNMWGATAPVVL